MQHIVNDPNNVHTVTTRNGYVYHVKPCTYSQTGDVVTFEARRDKRTFDAYDRVSILADEIASISESGE